MQSSLDRVNTLRIDFDSEPGTTAADVIRHELVARIVKAYDARDGHQEELKLGDDPNDGEA